MVSNTLLLYIICAYETTILTLFDLAELKTLMSHLILLARRLRLVYIPVSLDQSSLRFYLPKKATFICLRANTSLMTLSFLEQAWICRHCSSSATCSRSSLLLVSGYHTHIYTDDVKHHLKAPQPSSRKSEIMADLTKMLDRIVVYNNHLKYKTVLFEYLITNALF